MHNLLFSSKPITPMRTIAIYSTFALLFSWNYSFSQPGYYWSENFGNKSVLLSGTVNASAEDLGAVFSVNLSGQSVSNPDVTDSIFEEVRQAELPHGVLCFEITETAAITELARARDFIERMKEIGEPEPVIAIAPVKKSGQRIVRDSEIFE